MDRISLFVFAALLLCGVMGGPDNQGTEFIIGYMENQGDNMEVELFVTTMSTSTVDVTITAPSYSAAGINENFSIQSGEVRQLLFNKNIRMIGSSKGSKGILVSGTGEIVIYGVNKEAYSCDAFLGLPTDVLELEYFAVSHSVPSQQSELLVVGVEDGTSVTITLPQTLGSSRYVLYNSQYYYAGDVITESLNKYDTLQLVSSKGDLTGARIVGDKKLSVFSGNKKTNIGSGGSSDHLVEHLTPVSTWGSTFTTVPVPTRTTGDYFRIIASESNTQVQMTGGYSSTFTLANPGDFQHLEVPSTAYCLITSDKPILVVQFCLSQISSAEPADPMMMIIPPTQQFAADYTFATPKYSLGSYSNYFMFVIKENQKDGLRLDGAAFDSSTVYNAIPGTDYVGGYISVSEGSHTVRHTSTIAIFGGYLYGQAKFETYGFTTGMRMAPINTVCVPTPTVQNDGYDNDCDGRIDEEDCSAANNGADDDGDGVADEDCAKPNPVDGQWNVWSPWGNCSVTCGNGTYTRSRECDNPLPQYGGNPCVGSFDENDDCVMVPCPIDGEWSAWGAWGVCTKTCDTGEQSRSRSCDSPAAQYGGAPCAGQSGSYQDCNTQTCPTPVRSCSTGFYACPTGTIKCIDNSMLCDCDNDCDNGEDETTASGGCSSTQVAVCAAQGAQGASDRPHMYLGAVLLFTIVSLMVSYQG